MTKYEKTIVDATREFAKVNDIAFNKMTELMIINTIRTVRKDYKDDEKYTKEQILLAGKIGEINKYDVEHIVLLLDEAVVLEQTVNNIKIIDK